LPSFDIDIDAAPGDALAFVRVRTASQGWCLSMDEKCVFASARGSIG